MRLLNLPSGNINDYFASKSSTFVPDQKLLDTSQDSREENKSGEKKKFDFKSEEDFLYGQISGSQLEEFSVIKFNEKGKAQERLLCIDGFNIYSKETRVDRGKFSLSSFLPSNILGSSRKERPISSIAAWKRLSDTDFVLQFQELDKPNHFREVRYRT